MGERCTVEGTVQHVIFQNEENGYTKGHAEITLQEFRECEALRKIFTELYA